jgi:hypothetical protein
MTASCRGGRRARQRHTRGRAGERKVAGMASGSGTGGRARASWQHAGSTARACTASRVVCISGASATHGCVRAWARGGDWPEVGGCLTYGIHTSLKGKQRDWVHGADKLGHGRACAGGSRADAASHGSVQVGHVCETRESGLTDGARLAAR